MNPKTTYRPASTVTIPVDLIEAMKAKPINASRLVCIAIQAAHENPALLGKAFMARLHRELTDTNTKTSYSLYDSVKTMLRDLSRNFGISEAEVVKLAVEAYLYVSP